MFPLNLNFIAKYTIKLTLTKQNSQLTNQHWIIIVVKCNVRGYVKLKFDVVIEVQAVELVFIFTLVNLKWATNNWCFFQSALSIDVTV